jgi:hypothetical protein
LLTKFERQPPGKSSSEQINLTEVIIQATREYQMIVDDLVELLTLLSDCLLQVGSSMNETHQSGKQVIEELNKLYEN